jgi:hypothetical protein
MPHHEHGTRVGAQLRRVRQCPGDRLGAVVDERGKPHLGVQPVIRHHHDGAASRQWQGGEGVLALVARVPTAAVQEHDQRAIRMRRAVEIERVARAGRVGDVVRHHHAALRHRRVQQLRGGAAREQQQPTAA